ADQRPPTPTHRSRAGSSTGTGPRGPRPSSRCGPPSSAKTSAGNASSPTPRQPLSPPQGGLEVPKGVNTKTGQSASWPPPTALLNGVGMNALGRDFQGDGAAIRGIMDRDVA